jgi:hypothetical protein
VAVTTGLLAWQVGLPVPVAAVTTLLLAIELVRVLRQISQASGDAVVGIDLRDWPACRLTQRDGSTQAGHVSDATLVAGWGAILAFQPEGMRPARYVPVLRSMLDQTVLR